MYCTNCGQNLESEDNFCGKCGKVIRSAKIQEIDKPKIKLEPTIIERPIIQKQSEYRPPHVTPYPRKIEEAKAEKKKEAMRAELKTLLEKEKGREVTDQELFEAEHWLRGYAELALDSYLEDKKRKKKLEESPKGFHLEGEGYSCFIYGDHVSNDQTWYDKYGIKCLTCQSAINKKIIPATAAENKDS